MIVILLLKNLISDLSTTPLKFPRHFETTPPEVPVSTQLALTPVEAPRGVMSTISEILALRLKSIWAPRVPPPDPCHSFLQLSFVRGEANRLPEILPFANNPSPVSRGGGKGSRRPRICVSNI